MSAALAEQKHRRDHDRHEESTVHLLPILEYIDLFVDDPDLRLLRVEREVPLVAHLERSGYAAFEPGGRAADVFGAALGVEKRREEQDESRGLFSRQIHVHVN